jgi:F-type H+-transporting ATPase subunit delta
MAELATLARPYAEAAFQVAAKGDLKQAAAEIEAIATVAANAQLRQFADAPKSGAAQVFHVITSVVNMPLSDASKNLLRTVIDNGRLSVLPEIAAQFRTLANARSGVSDAIVHSAFAIDAAALTDLVASLEKRFGRKLNASVQIDPELIGGVRVVVGDEVLDTSIKARLEQMRAALTA